MLSGLPIALKTNLILGTTERCVCSPAWAICLLAMLAVSSQWPESHRRKLIIRCDCMVSIKIYYSVLRPTTTLNANVGWPVRRDHDLYLFIYKTLLNKQPTYIASLFLQDVSTLLARSKQNLHVPPVRTYLCSLHVEQSASLFKCKILLQLNNSNIALEHF